MASVTITFSHPQLTHSETLTVADARLVEFADLLRNYNYPQEGSPAAAISRAEAINRFAEGVIQSVRITYKGLKDAEARAALTPAPEIDA